MIGSMSLASRTGVVLGIAFAACSFSPGAAPRDGKKPIDAAIDAAKVPDGGPCSGMSATCAGAQTLRTCSGAGANPVDTNCTWGCVTDHCGVVVPAGGVLTGSDLDPSGGLTAVQLDGTLDDSSGAINGTSILRTSGSGVIAGVDYEQRGGAAIYIFGSLTVSGVLNASGNLPLILAAYGPIEVSAIASAESCFQNQNALGGRSGGTGNGGTGTGSGAGGGIGGNDHGGGGGGYGGTGGGGGGGPTGGIAFGSGVILLTGGGPGAAAGGGGNTGQGGAGGGVIELVSNTSITIDMTGGINAGGCGGTGGSGPNDGGGGGGAGGTIILEAPTISLAGILAVNGGGGGGGPSAGNSPGGNGTLDRTAAPGGNNEGGQGGAGGGLNGAQVANNNGGGGGAVGRMWFLTRDGMLTGNLAVLSPALTDNPTTTVVVPAVVQ